MAQPLRREERRNQIRNMIEFPNNRIPPRWEMANSDGLSPYDEILEDFESDDDISEEHPEDAKFDDDISDESPEDDISDESLEDSISGDSPEDEINNDGESIEDWNFGGLTMHMKLTAPMDVEDSWSFYCGAEELTGSQMLQVWGDKFTVL
ncbi:hypothetical protein PG994_008436 [Apiospora phragmitis]|uniref:Uncharacterized protein n=1 Tax=Apiospora phragmitis TaxID=2905665 RepID=A0ABR1UGG1_9PEZI